MSEAVATNAPSVSARQQAGKSARLGQRSPWWRGAVIYQIYPRSFFDANDDGIGDLRGIVEKLDYVASLGIDAVWVSPFFRSPMKDFGYDVSDYRSVDPIFGNLADFDALIDAAHQRGLKVIIDQVLSHSSDEHAWFKASRRDCDNAYANWYVWADPKPDGTPPNNWLSIFGGSAWQWESRREQYYLHNFLTSQPDLNYHEPEVVERMLGELRFWLERGVDGFRLDAINFCYHDRELRDNPAKPEAARRGRGFRTDNPYAWQRHIFDNTRPENIKFLERIRDLCNEYGEIATLGEVTSEDPVATMLDYTRGDSRLHMAYNFELLVDEFSLDHIRDAVEDQERNGAECWPCRAIGNHDVTRVATRWANGETSPDRAKLLNALLLTLRGTVCTYQGEELGLTEATISREQVRDPYGIAFWPNFKGRDGCRTPLPWSRDDAAAGFSTAEPWLPTPPEHREHAITEQEEDDDSVLNAYRVFVQWRREHAALRWGSIEFLDAPEHTLLLRRSIDGEALLCAFNFQRVDAVIELDPAMQLTSLRGFGLSEGTLNNSALTLPGYGAAFLRVADA
ncbi:MAG: alpha-amylase family glycosyl hydrolase [Pseudomonadota bacterium]